MLAMAISDAALICLLKERDGLLPERSLPHGASGVCRYAGLYSGRLCPWCEAAERRRKSGAETGETGLVRTGD